MIIKGNSSRGKRDVQKEVKDMDGQELIAANSDAKMLITNCVYELQGLASAFGVTGNKEVEARLFAIADDIEKSSTTMDRCFAMQITHRLRASQESAGNMVRAALAMCDSDLAVPQPTKDGTKS